jgi:hypothetical protein
MVLIMDINTLSGGISKYKAIISTFRGTNVSTDAHFQRLYKGFYFTAPKRKEWYERYFSLFEKEKNGKPTFESLLRAFAKINGSSEASFISKMLATIDDQQVIIDSKVLSFFGLQLKRSGSLEERLRTAVLVYRQLTELMKKLLISPKGQAAIKVFNDIYPNTDIAEIKKLDFVIYSGYFQ